MSDLAAEIESVRFTPVRLRYGYAMGEVDDLLDQLATAARSGGPLAPLVETARIEVVRLREGYDMDEVDAFLTRIAGRTITRTAPVPEPPRTGVVQEHPGPLARLRGLFRRAD